MPELPEVQTIALELDRKLKGLAVQSVEVRTPQVVSLGPAAVSNRRYGLPGAAGRFARSLRGRKVLAVRRRAKLLIFEFTGQLFLLAHLKMTGQFIFEDKPLRRRSKGRYRVVNRRNAPLLLLPGKHTHAVFRFAGASVLFFNDVRRFGYLKLVNQAELEQVLKLGGYGPEPLDKAFEFGSFLAAMNRRPRAKIKLALMDPKVIAGIGNIYSDEILFHAGVRPARPVASLSSQELRRIYAWIRPVLVKGIKAKGSSVGDFVRTDGSWGKMGKYHFVYGRGGEDCKNCGRKISSAKLGGRTASFCSGCQK